MIYLNNAATSYPKPQTVLKAYAAALKTIPETPFRGTGGNNDVFDECRTALGKLFRIKETERIVFTSGATDSFNFLLNGLDLEGKKILTTNIEHNSVLRPLYNLKKLSGCEIDIVSCDENGLVDPDDIRTAMVGAVDVVLINHCSNVTGAVQDFEEIGSILRFHECLFIADVSQSGGCLPVKTDEWGIDALVFTGHKSLFGPQGTGGFYLRKGIPLEPFRYGGTGTDGRRLKYGEGDAPFEVGTRNEAGIAALNAGIRFIQDVGPVKIMRKEQSLIETLISSLRDMPLATLYGESTANRAPVVSLTFKGLSPADLGYLLYHSYGIITRSGFHCCPLIHDILGTAKAGTLRISPSFFTETDEIELFLKALEEIQDSLKTGGAE